MGLLPMLLLPMLLLLPPGWADVERRATPTRTRARWRGSYCCSLW